MDWSAISLLVLDVDGVLTDGRIELQPDGGVTAKFHVQDGCAIKSWLRCGHRAAILSGRANPLVERRAVELGLEYARTGVKDKLAGFQQILVDFRVDQRSVGYIGDDLPDLNAMRRCGFAAAVADANPAVKRISGYVSRRRGGQGAVAEIIELVLRKQHRWSLSHGETA